MDTNEPKRRWYRKKRWWAAGLIWAFVVHEASFGPAVYCYVRGWTPGWTVRYLFPELLPDAFYAVTGLGPFNRWCQNLARRDEGKPEVAY